MASLIPPPPAPCAGTRPKLWAKKLLRLCGWHAELPLPAEPKALIVVYPHTSNWDFFLGILGCQACGWPIRWIAKHTLFLGPLGWIMRRLGGIPINRQAPGGFIERLTEDIRGFDSLLLAIAPEGTRRYVDHWKSGFLRIARAADLPLGLAYIDYRQRKVGIAAYLRLSGDNAADMARIAAAYAGIEARNPAQAGRICLASHADELKPGGAPLPTQPPNAHADAQARASAER